MVEPVDRGEVRRLAAGAQLVDVLPEHEFNEEHLPDAVSLPLNRFSGETPATLEGQLLGVYHLQRKQMDAREEPQR